LHALVAELWPCEGRDGDPSAVPDSSSGDYSDDAHSVRVEAAELAEMAAPVELQAGPRRPETVALAGSKLDAAAADG